MIDNIIKNNLISFLKFRTYTWISLLKIENDESILNWDKESFNFPITIYVNRDKDNNEKLQYDKYINLIEFKFNRVDTKAIIIEVHFEYVKYDKIYKFIYPNIIILIDKDTIIYNDNIYKDKDNTYIYKGMIYFVKNITKINKNIIDNIPFYDIVPNKILSNDIKFNFFNVYPINEISILDEDCYNKYLDYINDPTEKIYKRKNINKKENIFYLIYHKDLWNHNKTKGLMYVNSDPKIGINIEYRIV